MKFVSLLFVLAMGTFSYCFGQLGSSSENLFAQGMFTIQDADSIAELEVSMRDNASIKVVRLDQFSNRFFIVTKDISTLSEQDLRSWFGRYGARN